MYQHAHVFVSIQVNISTHRYMYALYAYLLITEATYQLQHVQLCLKKGVNFHPFGFVTTLLKVQSS